MELTSWFKVFWLVGKLTSVMMSVETLFFSLVALSVSAPVEAGQMLDGFWFYGEVTLIF